MREWKQFDWADRYQRELGNEGAIAVCDGVDHYEITYIKCQAPGCKIRKIGAHRPHTREMVLPPYEDKHWNDNEIDKQLSILMQYVEKHEIGDETITIAKATEWNWVKVEPKATYI